MVRYEVFVLGRWEIIFIYSPQSQFWCSLRSNLDSQQLAHFAGVLPWLIPPIFGSV
jgi:hypothetical protein